MKNSRVMIAGACSGSGKTMITCGVMRILKDDGSSVVPYKCGPDYIDPMYHRTALGTEALALWKDGSVAPGGNLDTFFTDEKTTIRLLYEGGYGSADIAVIEGVMGLYDGLGGTSLTGSSYELACVTKTPIILVVDAKGMGRSVLALIKGFLDYDEHKLIRGIIFNRVSMGYYERLKKAAESELKIKVVGYVPEDDRLHINSRHLGLVTPSEESIEGRNNKMPRTPGAYEVTEAAGRILRDTLDLNAIRAIAAGAKELDRPSDPANVPAFLFAKDKKINRIAVAADDAFCFCYRENLRYLKALGTELVPFSPLYDDGLPVGTDAILLSGGYPEEYLKELSSNVSMAGSLKEAVRSGCFIIAECGGFMYLQEVIKDKKGMPYKMTGILPGTCMWKGRLTRFGYVELKLKGAVLRGHEFHYYDSDNNGGDIEVIKASTGKSYRAMHVTDNMLAGFAHLYYPSSKYVIE